MSRPKRIVYVGTYERDYPRNAIVVAALRRAGFSVRELHQSVWNDASDKSAAIGSPMRLLRVGARSAQAYARLAFGMVSARKNIDVVAFGYIGQIDALILAPLARMMRKPILFNPLVTLTDTVVEDRERVAGRSATARLIRQVDRFALKLSATILADTEENRDYLVSVFGISPASIHVVPVGADETVFEYGEYESSATDNRHTVERQLRVLFYGNMIPLQGVGTIIRAAKLLEDRDVRFEVIGTGQVHSSVRQLADEIDVRNLNFVPRVPYRDLPGHIAGADVVLGIFGRTAKAGRVVPNKVYQAMAMGAAIVTRDSPAVRRVLRDGESALLVPPEDPGALAEAIQRLANRAERRRLGAAARARFQACASLDVQAFLLNAAVETALAESAPRQAEVQA